MANFHILILFTLLQLIKERSLTIYHCVYTPALFFSKPVSECPGFLCWESQLTDVQRCRLTNVMNKYKSDVALGTCASCDSKPFFPSFNMTYHWYTEYHAQKWLKNFPCKVPPDPPEPEFTLDMRNSMLGHLDFMNIADNRYSFKHGYNTFKIKSGGGIENVINRIEKALQHEEESITLFQSWSTNTTDTTDTTKTTYKFGPYAFFGCAFLIMEGLTGDVDFAPNKNTHADNETVAIVACVYLALFNKTLNEDEVAEEAVMVGSASQNKCHYPYFDAKQDEELGFCTLPMSPELRKFDAPCQIYYRTHQLNFANESICDEPIPFRWKLDEAPRPGDTLIYFRDLRGKIWDNSTVIYVIDQITTTPESEEPTELSEETTEKEEKGNAVPSYIGTLNSIIFVILTILLTTEKILLNEIV